MIDYDRADAVEVYDFRSPFKNLMAFALETDRDAEDSKLRQRKCASGQSSASTDASSYIVFSYGVAKA